MTLDLEAVFRAAVQLPPEQQKELIRRLAVQTDPPVELDEATWRTIHDRRAEYEAGKTTTMTWDEAKARLQARR